MIRQSLFMVLSFSWIRGFGFEEDGEKKRRGGGFGGMHDV
jgi:hypothetical protein